jgi:UDP-N-acetylglucosamine:LPS N-acetylglucosamine transferase
LPGTHQELNAAELGRQGAARVVDQRTLSPETFAQLVAELLADRAALGSMRERIGTVLKTMGGSEYLDLVLSRLQLGV